MKTKVIIILALFCCLQSFAQNGINWSPAIDVAGMSMYGNLHPRIALDNSGEPMVLWGKTGANQAYFSRWNGINFSTPVLLNPGLPVFSASWAGPDMASYGDTVYVVFKQTPEDTNHIFLIYSYNGGNTFSNPVQVDNIADSNSRFPSVAVDGNGNPLVAFMKFDPVFMNARYVVAKSNNFGNSFITDQLASKYSGGTVCDCCPATITAAGNLAAMIYRDNLNNLREMWAGISTDGGITFPNGMAVDQTNWMINACPSSGPDGVIIGDTLYSVFMSGGSGDTRNYWSKSSISAMQTGISNALVPNTNGLEDQNYPRIAHWGNAVAIAWVQVVSGTQELALLFTQDITSGFPVNYDTVDLNGIENVDIAINNGTIHVVWEDNNSGTVKYRKGTFQSTMGLTQDNGNLLSVFPNPVTGDLITVQSPNEMDAAYEIFDLSGRSLMQGQLKGNVQKINIFSLSEGIYLIKIKAEYYDQVVRFIKQQ